jgi:hypothetical protein
MVDLLYCCSALTLFMIERDVVTVPNAGGLPQISPVPQELSSPNVIPTLSWCLSLSTYIH